jgi:hypothetical protein
MLGTLLVPAIAFLGCVGLLADAYLRGRDINHRRRLWLWLAASGIAVLAIYWTWHFFMRGSDWV